MLTWSIERSAVLENKIIHYKTKLRRLKYFEISYSEWVKNQKKHYFMHIESDIYEESTEIFLALYKNKLHSEIKVKKFNKITHYYKSN